MGMTEGYLIGGARENQLLRSERSSNKHAAELNQQQQKKKRNRTTTAIVTKKGRSCNWIRAQRSRCTQVTN